QARREAGVADPAREEAHREAAHDAGRRARLRAALRQTQANQARADGRGARAHPITHRKRCPPKKVSDTNFPKKRCQTPFLRKKVSDTISFRKVSDTVCVKIGVRHRCAAAWFCIQLLYGRSPP